MSRAREAARAGAAVAVNRASAAAGAPLLAILAATRARGLALASCASILVAKGRGMARRVTSSRTAGVEETPEVAALYAGPLDEFTPARDRLARELRATGEGAAATRVKSLRKPSTAAWAINQLARRDADRVQALLDAGASIREAQRGGPSRLREATEAHRELVWELLQRARSVLAEAGVRAPDNHVDAIRMTLQAAPAATEYERALLRQGMLTRELEPAGFGDVMRMIAEEAGEEEPPVAAIDEPAANEPPARRGSPPRARAEPPAKRGAGAPMPARSIRRRQPSVCGLLAGTATPVVID